MATTIALEPELRDRLKTYGLMGDTYNDILRRLMDAVDREEFLRRIRRRARANTEWLTVDDLDDL